MAQAAQADEIQQKAQKMKMKSDHVSKLFQVSDTETVIQDYFCYVNGVQGRLWITQNYLCFETGDDAQNHLIPFFRINRVTDNGMFGVFKSLDLDTEQGVYHISRMVHAKEISYIIQYLTDNPPTYIKLSDLEKKEALNMGVAGPDVIPDKLGGIDDTTLGKNNRRSPNPSRRADYSNGHTHPQHNLRGDGIYVERDKGEDADIEKVDVEAAEAALRKAAQLEAMQAGMLRELELNAETLDRTKRNIDETKNYHDQSDRKLDGVESFAGSIKNSLTPNLHKNKLSAYEAPDRRIEIKEKERFTDIPILVKHPNCNLEPAVIRFGDEGFHVQQSLTGETFDNYKYKYVQVVAVCMRARHNHLDIWFKNVDRFRCLSSYLQAITNEIVLRTPHKARVIFEPNTFVFDYGSEDLRATSYAGGRKTRVGDGKVRESGFFRVQKTADVTKIMDKVDDKTKEDIRKQDRALEATEKRVSMMAAMTDAMGGELDRQIEQIDEIGKYADKTTEKAHGLTYRTNRMIK